MEIGVKLFSRVVFPCLKMGTKAAYFQRVRKICCDKLGLNIYLRRDIRTSEQPFVIKTGMPYNLVNVSVTDRYYV